MKLLHGQKQLQSCSEASCKKQSAQKRCWKAVLAAASRHIYFLHCYRSHLRGSQGNAANDTGIGMFAAAKHLLNLMQDVGVAPAAQQLMSVFIDNIWTCSTSSSSSSRSQQNKCKSFLQLGPEASQEQLHICAAAIHLALSLVSVSNQSASTPATASPQQSGFTAPLMQYLLDPASARHCYMLGAPADESMQLISRVSDGTTVYRCACGLPYLVGNCGQPTQTRKCPSPNCHYNLGGQNHAPAAGQSMLGNRGAVPDQQKLGFVSTLLPIDSVNSSSSTSSAGMTASTLAAGASIGVRDLQPSSCQVLRLLVHAALAVGAAVGLQPAGSLSSFVGVSDESAALQLVESVAVQQWQLLRRSLQASDEQVLAVLLSTVDELVAMQLAATSSSGAAGDWQLTRTADRQSWEQQFQHAARRWTPSPAAAVQQMMVSTHAETGADPATSDAGRVIRESSYIMCAVQEGLLLQVADSTHNSRQLLTLFRTVAEPSLDALAAYFWADNGNAALYPVTNAVLLEQQQQRCALLPHLLHLVQFESSVRQASSCIISRSAAQHSTLADYINNMKVFSQSATVEGLPSPVNTLPSTQFHPCNSNCSPDSSSPLNNQLQEFINSWNAVRAITQRFECKELVVPELATATAPLACACLSSRDEGLLLMAMMSELSQRHNDFLVLATQQQQQQQLAAMADTEENDQWAFNAQLGVKPVQAIAESDIINITAAMQQLQHLLASAGSSGLAYPGLQYGAGQALVFDLAAVEALLHERLVAGRFLLTANPESLQMFVYQGELFKAAATLLQQVDSRFPQQQQSLKELSDQATAFISQLPSGCTAAGMLPHLEVLLSFMKKTGGNSSSSVAEYVAAWLPEGVTQQLLMGHELLQTLQLQQVVGLYEGLLDVVASAVVIEDTLGTSYQQHLDCLLHQQVLSMTGRQVSGHSASCSSTEYQLSAAGIMQKHSPAIDKPPGAGISAPSSIPAKVVLVMLRRVMLRFLSSSPLCTTGQQQDQPVPPDVPLSIYCSNFDCCRWPWRDMGCCSRQEAEQLVEEVFPDTLLVGHIVDIAKLLQC